MLAALGMRLLAGARPDAVERVYSRGMYPWVARVLTAATGWAPFSVAEAFVIVLVPVGLFAALRGLARALRAVSPLRALAADLVRVAAATAAAYAVFLLLWGLNYQRRPLAASVGLPTGGAPREELVAACADLVDRAEIVRPFVTEDAAGVARVAGGRAAVMRRATLGFDAAAADWPVLAGGAAAAKPVWLSPGLAFLGISGIFVPFTGEANVNTTLPEWTLPFTAAHEIAHQRGFAREDEANYLAYVACRRHPDAEARYASALQASAYALGALRHVDPAAHAALSARRGPGTRRDLDALEAWRVRYESRAAAVNMRVNDAYLRSQGQRDGVASYGRMVDLLIAERRVAARGPPTAPGPR